MRRGLGGRGALRVQPGREFAGSAMQDHGGRGAARRRAPMSVRDPLANARALHALR